MSNKIFNVAKKELVRFFSDKRLVVMTLVMPAVLIYVLYSLMGAGTANMETVDEDYVYSVTVCGDYAEVFNDASADALHFELNEIEADGIADVKELISQKQDDLLIVFPEDFSMTDTSGKQNIEIYYNSVSKESFSAYNIARGYLDSCESSVCNLFNINHQQELADLSSEEDQSAQMISSFVPMLIIMTLFSSCLSLSSESIAGEKERGTMATVLVTPIKRSDLAFGKVISLSIISMLSGLSNFIGIILSIPKMLGEENTLSADMYSLMDYCCILLSIISAVLVIVSVVSLISAYSRSVKEASSVTMPLTLVATLLGMLPMLVSNSFSELYWYCIPIFNNILCFNKVLSFGVDYAGVGITVGVNILVASVMAIILSKMFDNEKIIFTK